MVIDGGDDSIGGRIRRKIHRKIRWKFVGERMKCDEEKLRVNLLRCERREVVEMRGCGLRDRVRGKLDGNRVRDVMKGRGNWVEMKGGESVGEN
jgi:hypothetical protein